MWARLEADGSGGSSSPRLLPAGLHPPSKHSKYQSVHIKRWEKVYLSPRQTPEAASNPVLRSMHASNLEKRRRNWDRELDLKVSGLETS